jgi:hypothetical protein
MEMKMDMSGFSMEKTGEWQVSAVVKGKVGRKCKVLYQGFTSDGEDMECILDNVGFDGYPSGETVNEDCRIG